MAVPDSFGIYLSIVKDLTATWLSERIHAQCQLCNTSCDIKEIKCASTMYLWVCYSSDNKQLPLLFTRLTLYFVYIALWFLWRKNWDFLIIFRKNSALEMLPEYSGTFTLLFSTTIFSLFKYVQHRTGFQTVVRGLWVQIVSGNGTVSALNIYLFYVQFTH